MTHPRLFARSNRDLPRVALGTPLFLALLTLWFAPCTLLAQSAQLPDAENILDRYIDVTGGRAAYQKIHNRVTKERLEHVGMGFVDRVTTYAAEPNKRFFTLESDALGAVTNGSNGEIAWYLSDGTGPLVETGQARDAALDLAAFDLMLNWRKYSKQVECAGIDSIDGRDCYKINLIPNHGEPETRFYDKESGLLVRLFMTRLSSNMPAMKVQLSFDDYKPVGGLLLPHRRVQVVNMCGSPREMRIVTDSIQHNVDLPADRFDPPAEILEQAKKIAAGDAEPQARPACNPSSETSTDQPGCGPAQPGKGCSPKKPDEDHP